VTACHIPDEPQLEETGEFAPPHVVGGVRRECRDEGIRPAFEATMPVERHGVLTAAGGGAEARHEQMCVGIEAILRPEDEGELGDEEVPVAAEGLAVEEDADAGVDDALSLARADGQRRDEQDRSQNGAAQEAGHSGHRRDTRGGRRTLTARES
jgi:hypothetical protein